MNEKQTSTDTPSASIVRPTKKQRELLQFIDEFIREHGYSPSYREIMTGLNYTSVATVSLHVNNLIKRGHIRKRDYSARSLEVVNPEGATSVTTNQVAPKEEKWLVAKVEHLVAQAEQEGEVEAPAVQDIETLLAAMQVLGMEAAAQSFISRVKTLRERAITPETAA
jgi:repressor LexA